MKHIDRFGESPLRARILINPNERVFSAEDPTLARGRVPRVSPQALPTIYFSMFARFIWALTRHRGATIGFPIRPSRLIAAPHRRRSAADPRAGASRERCRAQEFRRPAQAALIVAALAMSRSADARRIGALFGRGPRSAQGQRSVAAVRTTITSTARHGLAGPRRPPPIWSAGRALRLRGGADDPAGAPPRDAAEAMSRRPPARNDPRGIRRSASPPVPRQDGRRR